ncbi:MULTISPECIES: VG15 protein [unclassified Microbacterium]|uniref:VG15 protein n=1 Tax=unclassified Microbacterium TaxID=2609290 RepID=UPI0030161726
MAAPDYEALANAHMRSQVAHAGTVQAALARLWDETIDPADIPGSFLRFRARAAIYIGAGRIQSDRVADTYMRAIKDLAGLDAPVLVPVEALPAGRIEASLSAASSKALARASATTDNAEDLALAKEAMLGSAKRQIINASRARVIESTRRDPQLGRRARVGDGNPCAFCSMLISRGPVYSAISAHFAAHDKCGCNARPVTPGDNGWSPEARRYRDAWDADTRAAMRAYFEQQGLAVPERYFAREGEESFRTLMRLRANDKQNARRRKARAEQLGLAA